MLRVEGKRRDSEPLFSKHLSGIQSMVFSSVNSSLLHHAEHSPFVLVFIPRNCKSFISKKKLLSFLRLKIFQSDRVHPDFLIWLIYVVFMLCKRFFANLVPFWQQYSAVNFLSANKFVQPVVGSFDQELLENFFCLAQVSISFFLKSLDHTSPIFPLK